ncbi:30S ribosomal protein S9 [Candidatus Roizmanbacteria bacterium RIFCSPLOWO2_01_FULL_45_11]|uniref:30S ribosomal protein S9 n=1 Tax=Candidatus Roizmanbacteria bacterium RIFCSPLOWO2_01_FULL_45_11 TaxID=1802070 RepID=A0A1F7JHX0_9BACT|nr:MAG: 30S ribosomal protein S9 [Candidatus Roizmanbacteria bacterium RIFCSPLOWO2_01_FULL_45_11]
MIPATPKVKKQEYIGTVGRRRESTARVRLYIAKKSEKMMVQELQLEQGSIVVNGMRVQEYFPGEVNNHAYMLPLKITGTQDKYIVSVQVQGGGKQGQLGAAVHGIARALDKVDTEQYHSLLKKRGLLTRDPRMKERRKAGMAHKARARKQSPKR